MLKRVFLALLLLLNSFLLAGCGENPGPQTEVEGSLTYDGTPVASGIISFISLDSEAPRSYGAPIENGTYHVLRETGIPPGKYRVEIHWARPTGEKREATYGKSPDVIAEALPDKYHKESILTAELVAGANTVDFLLEK
jgi:hypothetical protein